MLRLSAPLPAAAGCKTLRQAIRARQPNFLGQLRCFSSGLGTSSTTFQATEGLRCRAEHARDIAPGIGITTYQKQRNPARPSFPSFSIFPRTQLRHFSLLGRQRSSSSNRPDSGKGYVCLYFIISHLGSSLVPLYTTVSSHHTSKHFLVWYWHEQRSPLSQIVVTNSVSMEDSLHIPQPYILTDLRSQTTATSSSATGAEQTSVFPLRSGFGTGQDKERNET